VLVVAYGGFLVLFASLGGKFTVSKLKARVHPHDFRHGYLQTFAPLTIFGGTTPGMDVAGLTGRKLFRRTAHAQATAAARTGYMPLSRNFFPGLLWAMWTKLNSLA